MPLIVRDVAAWGRAWIAGMLMFALLASSLLVSQHGVPIMLLSAIIPFPEINVASGDLIQLFVDCDNGSDRNGDGSKARPLGSLLKARNIVRKLQPLSKPVDVLVSGVCYPRSELGAVDFALPVLELEAGVDSGSATAPITYSAAPGAVRARLMSGMVIPASAWETGWDSILKVNLKELGVDPASFGDLEGSLELGGCRGAGHLELFFREEPMTLARYPNLESDPTNQEWLQVDETVEPADAENLTFTTSSPRVLSWTKERDAWVHGYWWKDWHDVYSAVTVSERTDGKPGARVSASPADKVRGKARFYGLNLLCELDSPGEYYLDKSTGELYFWPPDDIHEGEVVVSVGDNSVVLGATMDGLRHVRATRKRWEEGLESGRLRDGEALVFSERGAHEERQMAWKERRLQALRATVAEDHVIGHVTIRGFGVPYARETAVVVVRGQSVRIEDMEVRNSGHWGMELDGEGLSVDRPMVTGCGCGGILMSGGDVEALRRADSVVNAAYISRVARVWYTYNPHVQFMGVGMDLRGSWITHGRHSGFRVSGNDCGTYDNVFQYLCTDTCECGAWGNGRSWVKRGHVIAGNRFEKVQLGSKVKNGYPSAMAIHLDDQQAGVTVVNNSFLDLRTGLQLGGGRDISFVSNYCENVTWCVHIDSRGVSPRDGCEALVAQVRALDYLMPPYATAYPQLAGDLVRQPCHPSDLILANNVCKHCATFIYADPPVWNSTLNTFSGNTVTDHLRRAPWAGASGDREGLEPLQMGGKRGERT